MRRRGFVIGAGLSGLAAALELLDRGVPTTVFEASPHLGGRCRSYEDPALGLLDNGTHALTRANPTALALLGRLRMRSRWHAPPDGLLPLVDLAERRVAALRPTLRGFAALGIRASHILRLLGRDRAVGSLLDDADPGYRCVIEPLTVAALNTPAAQASSRLLLRVLREAWRGPGAFMPLVAEHGLGPDLVEPLAGEVIRLGGSIDTGMRLRGLDRDRDAVTALELGRQSSDAQRLALDASDILVLAVPPAEAERLTGVSFGLGYSPIVNAHFALSKRRGADALEVRARTNPEQGCAEAPQPCLDGALATAPRMIGVLGAAVQWVLLRGRIASITVSAADDVVDRPAAELSNELWSQTRDVLDLLGLGPPATPEAYRIVKEKRATIRQGPGLVRPGPVTPWRNLFLAGDWTDTGLPATIEGALRSGRKAVRAALRSPVGA